MCNILARANRGPLEQFARSRGLPAFSFDGTLAPVVSRPQLARLRPSTPALLTRASRQYPCKVPIWTREQIQSNLYFIKGPEDRSSSVRNTLQGRVLHKSEFNGRSRGG
jgi:hypothetical protein